MKFEDIDKLETVDIDEIYRDILDFGDDTHLAGCCCYNYVLNYGSLSFYSTWSRCTRWCSSQGERCYGWNPNGYGCDASSC